MTIRNELVEALAAIEHERWSGWQKYLHSRGHQDPATKKVTFDWDWIERWERQIATPYAELSEREKASDREQVMRYWPLIVDFVADWLREQPYYTDTLDEFVERWNQEMTDATG
jgi:hypothetical protein